MLFWMMTSILLSHYPLQAKGSPFTGTIPPNGHRQDDLMWPWGGTTPGYTIDQPAAIPAMLPNFSTVGQRRIKDTLNIGNLGTGLGGYQYE